MKTDKAERPQVGKLAHCALDDALLLGNGDQRLDV